jgi:protein O-GlcNAc transferase
LSDGVAADRIRFEQIDVLMDTTAHTFGSRLGIFARRAAPVQCTYIGYWSTTGLTEMDWFFADPHFPDWMEAHFTEKIWRLPRLFHCYDGEHSLPESHWAPDPEGAIWLGSFNRLSKIREQTLALWAKVLYELPQANLLFEDGAPYEEETHQRILSTLSDYGIPEYRVAFIPFTPGHERHMALYDRLDIALDTIPFNSGTTAFDALWMGVPLIALDGNWLGARLTASVLKAFDRPEWVAQDEEEYVSIVASLARDVEGRIQQRKRQRARMSVSPLCDAKAMARAMEDALEGMYDQWMAALGTKFALRATLPELPTLRSEPSTGLQRRG